MPRPRNSGKLDLTEVFRRVQSEMLARLSVDRLLEHPTSAGSATEQQWLQLFENYLPKRYRAAPAFVINASGHRSRQIDIAIYDNLHATPLFPHTSGVHVSIESVYAVFEVKPTISRQWLRDAGEKAASVRALHPTPNSPTTPQIIAGLLATSSVWTPSTYQRNLTRALASLPRTHRINIGCALDQGSFEKLDQRSVGKEDRGAFEKRNQRSHQKLAQRSRVKMDQSAFDDLAPDQTKDQTNDQSKDQSSRLIHSQPDEALMFFVLRLINRLNTQTPAPPADLLQYLKGS